MAHHDCDDDDRIESERGDYVIDNKPTVLGSGAYGTVVLGRDAVSKRKVAIKVSFDDHDAADALVHEYQLLNNLSRALHARGVARRGVHELRRRVGKRELRRRELVGGGRGEGERRVHLEVHVRPTARITPGYNCGEGDLPVAVRDLYAAEEILACNTRRIHRVVAVCSAVPEVDGRTDEGAARRGIARGEPDRVLRRGRRDRQVKVDALLQEQVPHGHGRGLRHRAECLRRR